MSAGAMLPVGTPNGSTAIVRRTRNSPRNTTMTISSTRTGVAWRTSCVWGALGASGEGLEGAGASFGGSGGAGGNVVESIDVNFPTDRHQETPPVFRILPRRGYIPQPRVAQRTLGN